MGFNNFCSPVSCIADVNIDCPIDLQVRTEYRIIACKSSCQVTNSDEDCCRGNFNKHTLCKSSKSAKYFEKKCPNAFSKKYDEAKKYYCYTNAVPYRITFG